MLNENQKKKTQGPWLCLIAVGWLNFQQVTRQEPFHHFTLENEFSSLTVGLLYSILALNTVARVLLINCKVHHATFLLRTLQKLPDSLVIKAKALSRAGTRVR